MQYNSTAFKLLVLFATSDGLPGFSLGQLFSGISAFPGTAMHQRITDLRRAGWNVITTADNTYWMPSSDSSKGKGRRSALAYTRALARKQREHNESLYQDRIKRAA